MVRACNYLRNERRNRKESETGRGAEEKTQQSSTQSGGRQQSIVFSLHLI